MDNKKNGIPKLRFPGFTGAWEQRKLGDLGKAKSGFGFPESEQGGKEGVPFFKVSDMNLKGNEFEMTTATNYVTHEQISLKKWKPIEEVPAIFFAKVGAAVLLNRKRLCRLPFLLDNNTMAFSFDVQKLDIDFTVSLFSKINLPALAQVGALPSYNTKDVESIKVYIPSLEEQKKIGVYLKKINNLIALHQRKLEHLQEQKKGLLQKMFPKNGETVPEVRFPGFTDAWEQRKLGEVYGKIGNAFVGTATPYYVDKENGHFYLESNNVKDGHINRNNEIFINDEFYKKQQNKWLHTGDIVMVQSGHVGHSAVIPKELNNIAAHALIMFRYPVEKVEPNFINYQFQTIQSKKKIENITTGNTIKHILASDLRNFSVSIPVYSEQEKVGNFLQHFDTLIALHQRKLEHLELMKKGLLQQMFV